MAKAKVKLDRNGMGKFLRGAEVQGMVRRSGDRIANAAGPGFEADTWIAPEPGRRTPARAVSGVMAETFDARRRQSRDNVLLRARDAGRT